MSNRHDDIQLDPTIDRLLRVAIQRESLSAEQHTRIQARLGLDSAPARFRRPLSTGISGDDAGAIQGNAPTVVNDDEQEKIRMLTYPRRFKRTEWLELAAVLAIVIAAVAVVLVTRGGSDNAPQQGGAPQAPATATTEPTPPPITTPTVAIPTPTVAIPPTPDANGVYNGLTIEQAHSLVPFPLPMPAVIPEGFDEPTISAMQGEPWDGLERTWSVLMLYGLTGDESPEQTVEYVRTNLPPQNPPGGEMTIVTLGGKPVNRAIIPAFGDRPTLAIYTWTVGDIHPRVVAELDGDLTIGLVEKLVAEILRADTELTDGDGESSSGPLPIGEIGAAGSFAVTVTDVALAEGPGFATPPADVKYVLISGVILNEGSETVPSGVMLDFDLQDASGRSYTHDVTNTSMASTEIAPGEVIEYELGYALPVDLTEFTLLYKAAGGTGQVTFAIQSP